MTNLNITGADNARREGPSTPPPLPQSATTAAGITNLPEEDAGSQLEAETKDSQQEPKPTLKLFTLNDVKRVVEVPVTWKSIYPGYEPWVFRFRLALSKEIDKQRQTFLGLPEDEARDQTKYRALILDQICDLLVDLPTGFGDMGNNGQAPGVILRSYVDAIKDPDQKETIFRILIAANNGYWNRCSPQSFSS